MARAISPSRLEAYRQQQVELAKKIKKAEAKEKQAEREKDDRRKLLAGAVALREFHDNPSANFAKALLGLLNGALTRPADRALFNLPALPNSSPVALAKKGEGDGEDRTAAPVARVVGDGMVFIPSEAEI